MVKNKAVTVEEYLEDLSEEARTVIATIRGLILRRLPTYEAGWRQVKNGS